MAAEENGDLPVPDLQTMEELCHPPLNGRGGPIARIAIQATNFGLKNGMIQQVHNSCHFHGLPGDDAKKHLDKFLHVTQSINVNGVTDDAFCLYLFSHSLTHHATTWFDCLLRNSINTFEQMAKIFLGKYFPPFMVTMLRNKITNFRQRPDESLFEAWERYKLSIDRCLNHNMLPVTQIDTFYYSLTLRHRDTINAAAGGTFIKRRPEECYDLIENMTAHHKDGDTLAQRSESSSSITSSSDTEIAVLKSEMAEINKNLIRVLQTNMTSLTNLNLELKNMFDQFMKMNTTSSSGSRTLPGNTITNPKEDLKGITTRRGTAYPGPTIPTNSFSPIVEREIEETKETSESLILTSEPVISPNIEPIAFPVSAPKPNLKPLIPYPSRMQDQKLHYKANDQRDKFFQIFKDLNFNISFADALILMSKFSPWGFLISCDFSEMAECLALADLDASINLMPLSVWNKLSLLDLSPTYMTLKLADRSISRPVGVAKDVFVKVGELTFRVGKEAITFNLDQTSRYSANYNEMTANRIDVIDKACEEYSQEFLDDPTSPEVDQSYLAPEGDILLLEAFLNDDPSLPLQIKEIICLKFLNEATRKDHFPLPFMDQMLERLAGNQYYCFLDGFSGYFRIPIDPKDQEKTTFTYPYEMFAYRRMPFGLCNAPGTFQSFLGHTDFYRRFIQDFSKIARPMTRLLKKDTPFFFSKECVEAFQTLKRKLTEASILIALDWDMPFKLMCDASDFAIRVKDSKERLLRWVLLLQEFTFKVIDIKGAENLAADHLSQLENPHQNVLDPKEINESFPLETLNLVSSRGNSSTP
nr:retrovirus-related Pol polyprotein from transposon 17.6 [Tanacetum cinerariifolium]